jgi:hypothetical protein
VSHFSDTVSQPGAELRGVLRRNVLAAVTRCAALLPGAAIDVVSDALHSNQAGQPPTPSPAAAGREHGPGASAVTSLVYELLDAHDDTAQMASEPD